MNAIGHIIHPVIVDESSDLVIAQPITFETMNRAAGFSDGDTDVSLYAVQYHDEARIALPGRFVRTPDLRRCATDIKTFRKRKDEYNDYFQHNQEQYSDIFNRLESQLGPLDPARRSYLLNTGSQRRIPTFD